MTDGFELKNRLHFAVAAGSSRVNRSARNHPVLRYIARCLFGGGLLVPYDSGSSKARYN